MPRQVEVSAHARAKGLALARTIESRIAALPRWQRLAAIPLLLLMTLLPAALAIGREDRFESSVRVSALTVARPDEFLPLPDDLRAYIPGRLDTRFVTKTIAGSVDFPLDPADVANKVSVVPGGSPTRVLLRVADDTPARARVIAANLGPIVLAQLAIDQRERIGERLRRLERRAAVLDVTRAQRAALERRSRALRRVRARGPIRLGFKRRASTETGPTNALDKLVDRLPGEFSRGPSPLWSGLAGLTVAMSLGALWLIFVARGEPGGRRAPGDPAPLRAH